MRMLRTQNSDFTRLTQLRNNGAVACWCQDSSLKPDETSEKLTKAENDQIPKEVRPHEVFFWCKTPRNDEPASGSRLRECIQNFETLGKEIQFTRICENATFFHRVSFRMCYKTVPPVEDGFWRSNSSMQRVYTPRADSNSRFYAHNGCPKRSMERR